MSWPSGKTRENKTGGRKQGTPNRRTLFLDETFGNLGLNVPEKINELLPELPPNEQINVLLKLMEFLYPKRKAIEVKDEREDTNAITHSKILEYINRKEF